MSIDTSRLYNHPIAEWDLSERRLIVAVCFIPLSVFFLFIWVIPIVYALGMSLFDNPLAAYEFVWFDNYIELVGSATFIQTGIHTVTYAVGTTIVSLVVGMALALAVNTQINDRGIITSLMITTYLIPIIATAFMWSFLLDSSVGLLNSVLSDLGLLNEPIAYLANPSWAMPSLILISVWKYAPFAFFILLARLQALDDNLYERARIEGATSWQAFRYITLPQLKSSILLIVLLRGIFMFNKFDLIWILTKGGPIGATTTYPIEIYQLAFNRVEFGSATALAAIMFFVLCLVAIVYFKFFSPEEEVTSS